MSSPAGLASGFVGKALFLAPVAFALGLFASEYQRGLVEEDAVVARRVAQRLGTWRPPALSPDERARLEAERDALRHDIVLAEARLARAQADRAEATPTTRRGARGAEST